MISGRTTIVRNKHDGYLYTQNYVKLLPEENIDKKYLVYILNESDSIKGQWLKGLQGSVVLKHTMKQLRELVLPKFHSYEKQVAIGNIYFDLLKVQALKTRIADSEKVLMLEMLKEVR